MLDVNPAKVGVDNPVRRRKEQHPFESWTELEALPAAIGPRYGPMVLFAAATGLRPAEWIALQERDVNRNERVVYVRRSFTRGQLKIPKTEASTRGVPDALKKSDRGPARGAEVARDAARGLDDGGAELPVVTLGEDPLAGAYDADCADRLRASVEDRGRDTPLSQYR